MRMDEAHGATTLDADERDGLLLRHVSTRGELDELEEANIQVGVEWARRVALGRERREVLSEAFLFELHLRMFGEVWEWAGRPRRTERNIGIDPREIRPAVRDLVEDARVWTENAVYPPDERAVRFHHRLVWIHCFPNGNGRHARVTADLVVQQAGRPPFSWGGNRLTSTSQLRAAYISALRAADCGEFGQLLAFARS
jgi:Fic-DOC domain mobile mystery protein B